MDGYEHNEDLNSKMDSDMTLSPDISEGELEAIVESDIEYFGLGSEDDSEGIDEFHEQKRKQVKSFETKLIKKYNAVVVIPLKRKLPKVNEVEKERPLFQNEIQENEEKRYEERIIVKNNIVVLVSKKLMNQGIQNSVAAHLNIIKNKKIKIEVIPPQRDKTIEYHYFDQSNSKDLFQLVKSDIIMGRKYPSYTLDNFGFETMNNKATNITNDFGKQFIFKGDIYGKYGFIKYEQKIIGELVIDKPKDSSIKVKVYLKDIYGIYYLLKTPKRKYADIYTPFKWSLWLIVSFIFWLKKNQNITYNDIDFDFHNYLSTRYQNNESYIKWKKASKPNIRYALLISTLQCMLYPLMKSLYPEGLSFPIFNGKYTQPSLHHDGNSTLVTPNVYKWFYLLFSRQMEVDDPNSLRGFFKTKNKKQVLKNAPPELEIENIKVKEKIGDKVVSIKVGGVELRVGNFVEMMNGSEERDDEKMKWIARIISFDCDSYGDIGFKLVWLYTIQQTVLNGISNYNSSELFYTFHCECNTNIYALNNIKCKVNVSLGIDSCKDLPDNYFCRYFYDQAEMSFIKLDDCRLVDFNGEFVCKCNKNDIKQVMKKTLLSDKSRLGHTFILDVKFSKDNSSNLLRIGQLVKINISTNKYRFRLFSRAKKLKNAFVIENDKKSLKYKFYTNELILLNKEVEYDINSIISTCHVEYLDSSEEELNLPYNLVYNGSGNQYFFRYISDYDITLLEVPKEKRVYKALFPSRNKILKHNKDKEKLKVLDLFSGSGSLGLGVTDSGLAESKWAIDFEPTAIESYKLNTKDDSIKFYTEDINNSFKNILHDHESYPEKGEVDFIVAGTPCQGYSRLNSSKESDSSLLKNSLITSLASFVDHYRPKFILLEQVNDFVKVCFNEEKERYPFDTLISFFLSIGYQVRFNVLCAANHGTCQNRNRVFIWCAAYNQQLPPLPFPSHLGLKPNYFSIPIPDGGETEIQQLVDKAPLPPITIEDTIGDLPPIINTMFKVKSVNAHHVAPVMKMHQNNLNILPTYKGRGNLSSLINMAKLYKDDSNIPNGYKQSQERLNSGISNDYRRVDPNGQSRTITTNIGVMSRCNQVHYVEKRILSVRECARIQGFLDSDQFVGSINEQYKIIGNAVPRPVSFALSLGLEKMPNLNHVCDDLVKKRNYLDPSAILQVQPASYPNEKRNNLISYKFILKYNEVYFEIIQKKLSLSNLIERANNYLNVDVSSYRLVFEIGYKKFLLYNDISLEKSIQGKSVTNGIISSYCIEVVPLVNAFNNLTNVLNNTLEEW